MPGAVRSRPRGWIIEAIVAVVALTCCALAVDPAAPATPDALQVWSAGAGPQLVALGRDIADLQSALALPTGPTPPGHAGPRIVVLTARLGKDLARARSLTDPPGADLRRTWASALAHGAAAVRSLTGSAAAPPSGLVASARADLELAGEDLVAVTQGSLPGPGAR